MCHRVSPTHPVLVPRVIAHLRTKDHMRLLVIRSSAGAVPDPRALINQPVHVVKMQPSRVVPCDSSTLLELQQRTLESRAQIAVYRLKTHSLQFKVPHTSWLYPQFTEYMPRNPLCLLFVRRVVEKISREWGTISGSSDLYRANRYLGCQPRRNMSNTWLVIKLSDSNDNKHETTIFVRTKRCSDYLFTTSSPLTHHHHHHCPLV